MIEPTRVIIDRHPAEEDNGCVMEHVKKGQLSPLSTNDDEDGVKNVD